MQGMQKDPPMRCSISPKKKKTHHAKRIPIFFKKILFLFGVTFFARLCPPHENEWVSRTQKVGWEPESLIGERERQARPLFHAGVAGLGWEFIRRKEEEEGGKGSQTSGFARLHGHTLSR